MLNPNKTPQEKVTKMETCGSPEIKSGIRKDIILLLTSENLEAAEVANAKYRVFNDREARYILIFIFLNDRSTQLSKQIKFNINKIIGLIKVGEPPRKEEEAIYESLAEGAINVLNTL